VTTAEAPLVSSVCPESSTTISSTPRIFSNTSFFSP
jgi:hypothetical protein